MFIQKNHRLVYVNKNSEVTDSLPVKEHKLLNAIKKYFNNIIWNIKNFKYHKLALEKNLKLDKEQALEKKVLSLNELIKDETLIAKTENSNVKKKKNTKKIKKNIPKKKKKSKKKKKKRR